MMSAAGSNKIASARSYLKTPRHPVRKKSPRKFLFSLNLFRRSPHLPIAPTDSFDDPNLLREISQEEVEEGSTIKLKMEYLHRRKDSYQQFLAPTPPPLQKGLESKNVPKKRENLPLSEVSVPPLGHYCCLLSPKILRRTFSDSNLHILKEKFPIRPQEAQQGTEFVQVLLETFLHDS
jgi:hypothetical protein